MTLDGKVIVVTGGGRGIGRGISLACGGAGASVAVLYRNGNAQAEGVVHALRERGNQARAYRADVTSAEEVDAVFEQVIADFGTVDVLVNNAGVATRRATDDLTEAEWDHVVKTNLTGAFLCSKAVLPAMREQRSGRIVNIASVAGQTGGLIGAHYAASKAGMIGMTRFMARELGPVGITVNAIAPAGIESDMLRANRLTPIERPIAVPGTPADVGAAVCFLASPAAGYVTGQVLGVNGGSFVG